MKVELRITDDDGNIQHFVAEGSLQALVWDAFLTADLQDQHWRDIDTCNLIIKKLKGESPIKYAKNG